QTIRPFVPFLPVDAPAAAGSAALSLHDALPIYALDADEGQPGVLGQRIEGFVAFVFEYAGLWQRRDARAHRRRAHVDQDQAVAGDRKSTRLNSSHVSISYAVFCSKNKKSTKPTY